MAQGTLILVFRTGTGALPVEGAQFRLKNAAGVTVATGTAPAGGGGLSEPLLLEAPDASLTLDPDSTQTPYAVYSVEVSADNYHDAIVQNMQIFADTTSRQIIELLPLPRSRRPRVDPLYYPIGPHGLRLVTPDQSQSAPPDRILNEVIIPEFITVHLGTPTSGAENVTVPFLSYIKNVASSEIYPTWPEASLRANILAQISLALNRIYTEWYPSRGYTYNITNSTAYDQYFIYGRNIYDSVSAIADELFNTYLRKPGREEPYYAEYCNGTTVTCPGMSQWGTVSLAQNGLTPEQILEFYYGDIDLVTTNNIQSIPESYPGEPLSIGSTGDAVATLQLQLDRIAINYPSIPLVFVDGVFGEGTQRSVRAFQRIAGLAQDGVVGRSTWYSVSYYYTAVKKLAELTSEGELPIYNDFAYPGLLRLGDTGTGVQEVQFFLRTLAAYNPSIPSVTVDGIFGRGTQNAVRAFQSFYNEVVDGIVGRNTWNTLVDQYRGTHEVPVPSEPIVTREYPGTLIRQGSTGSDVSYIQGLLNSIGNVFAQIPTLAVDGVFGAGTGSAVIVFQRLFGLSQDGIVGKLTWDRLNEIYVAVADGCIYESEEGANTRPWPGVLVRQGSTGDNVRYVQNSLNRVRTVLRTVPALAADGVFGAATRGAVVAFQGIFGLSQDGIVGQNTWSTLNYLQVAIENGCLYENLTAVAASAAPAPPPAQDALRVGSFGPEVLLFKRALAKKTQSDLASIGNNFLFGMSTRRLVEIFQESAGLAVTGVADKETIQRVLS